MGQGLEASGATRSGEGAEAAGFLLGQDELVFVLLLLDNLSAVRVSEEERWRVGAGKEGARTSSVERDGVGGQGLMGMGTSTLRKSQFASQKTRARKNERRRGNDMSKTL